MSTIRYTRSVFTYNFWANFSLHFPRKRLQWEKYVIVPCLHVIMITLFLQNKQLSSLFAQKVRINTEQKPPGHPIILLRSNKFNMAAVSVKRSVSNIWGKLPPALFLKQCSDYTSIKKSNFFVFLSSSLTPNLL